MSLKTLVSGCLERFEAGRAFKARLGSAWHEQAGGSRPGIHPALANLRFMLVEASFLCNLECRMCPRLIEGHAEGLMPLSRFQRLIPLMRHLDAVGLTGYGEPMVHPHLHEFAAVIRSCGAKPRLSTNGTLLNEVKARQLLDAGIENLQFSIDAGTKETFEHIRVGAKWERVLRNAERFNELARDADERVVTGWVFLMLRNNWRELPLAAEHAARCGFQVFIAKLIERNALDYEQQQNLHSDDGELLVDAAEFAEVIARVEEIGRRHGMTVEIHPFRLGFNNTCLADPLQMIFVDWMGNVTPCCHLPVRNEQGTFPAHSFGNLDEQDIMEILLGRRAQHFWSLWRNRTVPSVCRNCYQVKRMPGRESFRVEGA
ncbi:MAG: radical SAM protein [Candidatus Sumerlaeaceae bacterium]|nr:radical SAM protein [Candidatus Sumerlaeaceae bacterium]